MHAKVCPGGHLRRVNPESLAGTRISDREREGWDVSQPDAWAIQQVEIALNLQPDNKSTKTMLRAIANASDAAPSKSPCGSLAAIGFDRTGAQRVLYTTTGFRWNHPLNHPLVYRP